MLVLAATVMVAGLAAWTWYDFSDVLADAETIDRSTAMAMDAVARNSLQAVDGVLESILDSIDKEGIVPDSASMSDLKQNSDRHCGATVVWVVGAKQADALAARWFF